MLIVSWFGNPTADAARALGPIFDDTYARTGADRLSYIYLVTNNLSLPDASTRAAIIDLAHAYGNRAACVGVVVSGTGFWASAIRSFITGIRVLASRAFELRMHAEISELAEWFPEEHERRTGVKLAPAELVGVVELALEDARERRTGT